MKVIPVIDVLNGVVVHAKRGERATYQAIQSKLTHSSKPLDIVAALLDIYPFQQLYIADLNAIQKLDANCENNYNVIASIKERYPALELWVDAGISNQAELIFWQKLDIRLIIGSENFNQISHFTSLITPEKNYILSLDFMPLGYQGPIELLTNTQNWPQDVIVMSLSNVGSNNGVNIELMRNTIARAKGFNLIAAGGIRDADDLNLLKEMGVCAALLATALHQKQISTEHLESIN
ncbi:MAG: HisA/HisF-related TIM barrel protein [Methylotenera sp.]|uniref:HisA/HisF-related TIM barrel protein n=1 Tax=Methylotenera sp. TaxID=2051956 RepID=UPI0024884C46|nr:HisA/HisF-related TIM barrel protein [Methylotenera sp.]MDI1309589.1 HisA/HisF-related TIM barrel protein [Methylotenera sp.]